MSWRATILRTLHDEGELAVDALHEGTSGEGDAGVDAMYAAVERLEREGLVEDDGGTLTLTDAGAVALY